MRRELRAMVSLAWPVILAELGWVFMGIVDTVFVGPLGPAAIAAVGTGSTMFFAFMVLGVGTFFALDTFVAQSYGARRIDECHRWLFAGLQLALALSVVLIGAGLLALGALPLAGIHPEVLALLDPYLHALLWSAPPLLLYTVLRRYLQAMNHVRPVMLAIILANLIIAAANWVLVYGHFGVPALGAIGAAYATLAARLCMLGTLCVVVLMQERARPAGLHDVPFTLDPARMWRIARLGLPAAFQVVLEVGVFAAASALAGRISPSAAAANQIVLNIAGFFFMIPLGLSSAAAVRVGQAVGRCDPAGARRAGWSAIGLSFAAALAIAAMFILLPTPLLAIFTRDASVIALGATLLFICALFQPFDGIQAVATGALRGLGDTRTPMWFNLVGHWVVGLPLAYVLCFERNWGVIGLWVGLAFSLMLVGVSLLLVWRQRSRLTRKDTGYP
jgi:MATE family multidrug resistance protein